MPSADRMKTVWMMVCHMIAASVSVVHRTPAAAVAHSGKAPSVPASMKVLSR